MTMLEIVLMICGIICVIVSFMLGNGRSESGENQIISADLTEKQKENIQNQINEVVEQQLEALSEKTEVSLEKISNIKIIEMNEYADTVLSEINRNHNETIFLYDMLNEKAKEVKATVKDVNITKKQVEKIQSEVSVTDENNENYDFDKENVAAAISMLTNNTTTNSKHKENVEKSLFNSKKIKKTVQQEIFENVTEMNIQFEKGSNNNDKILNLYKDGKSNKDIAKELNLGVGEVKLVIDIYNSGI